MDATAVSRFRPKPSCRVRKATVSIARNERQNESSRPERSFHLMKSPPVLQRKAAAKTKSRGVVCVDGVFRFTWDIGSNRFSHAKAKGAKKKPSHFLCASAGKNFSDQSMSPPATLSNTSQTHHSTVGSQLKQRRAPVPDTPDGLVASLLKYRRNQIP